MLNYDTQDRILGTELITSSVSSGGNGNPADTSGLSARNPHIIFHSNLCGYLRATLDPAHLTVDFRAVDATTTPGHRMRTLQRHVIEAGNPDSRHPECRPVLSGTDGSNRLPDAEDGRGSTQRRLDQISASPERTRLP
jgi:hypothetical protein